MTVCVSNTIPRSSKSSNNSWQPKLRAPPLDPLEESLMSIVDALTLRHVEHALIGSLTTEYRSRPHTKDFDLIHDCVDMMLFKIIDRPHCVV